ncbi:hypothetical protein ITP53_43785 [Nonomuraea sp. K274]|uniref:Uncharacterized protein n=1 Tax=Nonomuraea cypriaca TaxID=1187855 RepID=A0A931AK77_9ACTN|nr:hypothetical protein [Nonomuraea cypriaca]MBF8192489.1 hypothetical protein [Nonomuraea cypriaca]
MLLHVVTSGDVLRHERQTRALYAVLTAIDGVNVDYLIPEPDTGDGRKGGVAELALVAAVSMAARPAVQLLITAIKEWCATERNRKVVVKDGDRTIEITGRPDAAQERLIERFLDGEQP